ncbi:MAG: N-(5'-phosphoribosyl)anthranilate isomerase [Alphaproteobacteria bacterium MarineAlpha11_Bin1]|nr:MAG: N-(5'-phosphoribosyl)anthranilate isomerase [Alphaproteobacteria bacterium MarineAlpha11_Bin1]|tara:strand:- start:42732 stop:43376 length:645 start_codon:yes stop_codon:yes gene_type:complete
MVASKICGVSTREAIDTAVIEGAAYLGFVFFPRSPRNVELEQAASLLQMVPNSVKSVALVVDPDDTFLDAISMNPGISMFQLHGDETPERAAEIKKRTGRSVIKAIKISEAVDLAMAMDYSNVVDMLLFDAKAPIAMKDALPGGNAVSFDWAILSGKDWPVPWMLSGGLDPDNVAEAIRIGGAPAVDVSSGVESAPGVKDSGLIRAFLTAVKSA